MIEKIAEILASLPEELYVFIISMLPIIELRGAIPVGTALGLPFYLNYLISVVGNLLPVPFILAFIPIILNFMARFKIFRPIVLWLRKKADKHKGRIIKGEDDQTVAEAETGRSEQSCKSVNGGENVVESDANSARNSENVVESDANSARNSENVVESDANSAKSSENVVESAQSRQKKGSRRLSMAVFAALMLFVAIPLPGTGAWTGSLVAALFDLPKRSSFLAVALGVLVSGVIMCLASYGVLGFLSFLL